MQIDASRQHFAVWFIGVHPAAFVAFTVLRYGQHFVKISRISFQP